LPAFHRFPRGIRLFAKLDRVMVAAIWQQQRPNDVALTHLCPNSVEISALRACATQRRAASLRSERRGRVCQAAIIPRAALRDADLWASHRPIMQPHLASDEIPSHLVMQAWEKHSKQHIICHSRKTSAEASVRGTKVWPALNAPNKPRKNARIGSPFTKGNAQWLAADVRGGKQHS
jgi:hypothetical protein